MTSELLARLVLFVVMVGSGVLLVWMSKAAASGRLKRNAIAGIRTSRTMGSDEAWLAAHRRAERPTALAGIVSIISGAVVLLPVSLEFVGGAVIAGCVVMLVLVIWAGILGDRAARDIAR